MQKVKLQKLLPTKRELESAFNKLCKGLPEENFISLELGIKKLGESTFGESRNDISIILTAYTNRPIPSLSEGSKLDNVIDKLLLK